MEKNTQQPVAFAEIRQDGFIVSIGTKEWATFNKNKCVAIYTAPPVPRDVLMVAAEEVQSAVKNAARAEYSDHTREDEVVYDPIDLAAIADRYASKVQPEPVNQQLLAALKSLVGMDVAYQRGPKVEQAVETARAAIAAAEAAQPVGDKTWFDGYPPFPQDQEWFIAITTYGDRVVLRALDKDYSSYQYTTADHTYIKKESIAHWMQFPDCEYLPPKTPQPASGQPVAVPDGFVLVPARATQKMIEAAEGVEDLYRRGTPNTWATVYHAMLSAAQKPEGV